MLDVRRMRVLREVAVRGSFSAAAEALSFTPSAISQQIAALERHTGAILARLSEAEAELEAIAGLREGRLRLASFESAAATLMPLAIAAFRAKHPAVELSMIMGEPEDTMPLLKSGELDLVLGFDSRIRDEVDGVSRQHLVSDPMFLVMAT